MALASRPPLTTVDLEFEELGRRTANLLLDAIAGSAHPGGWNSRPGWSPRVHARHLSHRIVARTSAVGPPSPARLGRVLRKLLIGVAVIATFVAGVAPRAWSFPADPTRGVVKQLAFLRAEIEGGAATPPKAVPGGLLLPQRPLRTDLGAGRARRPGPLGRCGRRGAVGLDRLQSADGTAPFDASLKPEYGVFHAAGRTGYAAD